MIAVYCANRALYLQLPTAVNSLLINNPNVKKIYLLIEDSYIDNLTDTRIEFINCSNFDFLIRSGLNITRRFPYMATARCFLPLILKENKILYLDVDTVVDAPIDDLWNIELESNCVGAREEFNRYFNSGVLLMNLAQIKAGRYVEQMSRLLKGCKCRFPDQDIMNIVFKNHVVYIPEKFNKIGAGDDVYNSDLAIRHFAGLKKPWQEGAADKDVAIWKKYETSKISSE